jgi:hypothetical protein
MLPAKYPKDREIIFRVNSKIYRECFFRAFRGFLKRLDSAQRRKTLKTHEGIKFFLAQIAWEIKNENVNSVSLVAEGLHQNFYENAEHPDSVKKGAKTVKQFVIRMRNRFSLY